MEFQVTLPNACLFSCSLMIGSVQLTSGMIQMFDYLTSPTTVLTSEAQRLPGQSLGDVFLFSFSFSFLPTSHTPFSLSNSSRFRLKWIVRSSLPESSSRVSGGVFSAAHPPLLDWIWVPVLLCFCALCPLSPFPLLGKGTCTTTPPYSYVRYESREIFSLLLPDSRSLIPYSCQADIPRYMYLVPKSYRRIPMSTCPGVIK